MDRSKLVDRNGRNVTLGLFKEFSRPDVKFKWVYTLPQVKEIFLAEKDPSEYKAAFAIVGDWEHWLEVRQHPLIKPFVDKWQEELAVKLRSEAITQMQQHARLQGGTAAAKWLADKGYADVEVKRGRGRQKKEDLEPDHSHVEEKLAKVLSLVK